MRRLLVDEQVALCAKRMCVCVCVSASFFKRVCVCEREREQVGLLPRIPRVHEPVSLLPRMRTHVDALEAEGTRGSRHTQDTPVSLLARLKA